MQGKILLAGVFAAGIQALRAAISASQKLPLIFKYFLLYSFQ
jgi:hypothetical protein